MMGSSVPIIREGQQQPPTKLEAKRVSGRVQQYEWGKVGKKSAVYQLLPEDERGEETKPFAEFWMGTHPNAPSTLLDSEDSPQTLKDFILTNPELYLGADVLAKFGPDLPFLFKVLSVSKALSIQAHPDKTLAKRLHQSFPEVYKDPNHKPEMTIALTQFEALCGFRPLGELDIFLKEVPELSGLLGEPTCHSFLNRTAETKHSIKDLFSQLMKSSPDQVTHHLDRLLRRLEGDPGVLSLDLVHLIQRLSQQYPGDVGIFCVFFLNHLTLERNQAMFLEANEPHAYIYGDCIECMATSDNVVRAGLTPKFKDVDVLVDMLTYESKHLSDQLMTGQSVPHRPHTILYDPPIPEFAVHALTLPTPNTQESGGAARGPGLLLITEAPPNSLLTVGSTTWSLSKGAVYFIPPHLPFTLVTPDSLPSPLVAYFAFCEVSPSPQ